MTRLAMERDTSPVLLAGVRATTLAWLRAALAPLAAGRALVVSDLSLGAWRSHQVASELCAQLGLPGPRARAAGSDVGNEPGPSFADVIGELIDAEGRGDSAVLTALELAARVGGAADGRGHLFVVIAPRFGLGWEREDGLFVRFLAQALRGRGDELVLVGCDAAEPHLPSGCRVRWTGRSADSEPIGADSLLGLVPGVVDADSAAAVALVEDVVAEAGLALRAGHLLVAPERRRDPRQVSRLAFDRLALATRPSGWLHAYAQYFGNNFYVDPWFLWTQARQEFDLGGSSIALRLLERARECSREPLQLGVLESLEQGIRLASGRFAEASAHSDPAPGVPAVLRGFLLEAKGWAFVMSATPEEAEPYFRRAHDLLDPGDAVTREYLYLLNIWALNRLRLGDADGALVLEERIEAEHTRLPRRDWRLEYVNAINVARLCRRNSDFDRAEEYYARAFATTRGTRTEGDCVYTNVCLARLEEARGRSVEAFACWLRAALHWASCAVPEALGSRIATAIVDRHVPAGATDPDEVSEAFVSVLARAAAVAGIEHGAAIDVDGLGGAPPVFVRSDGLPRDHELESAVLGRGWSVVTSRARTAAPFVSPAQLRLCAVLARILAAQARMAEPWPTIVVDDRFGAEMALDTSELVEVGLRLGVPMVTAEGRSASVPAAAKLWHAGRVRIGPAVDRIVRGEAGAWVVFKRYLSARPLRNWERRIVDALADPLPVEELAHEAGLARFEAALRGMERSRLVTVEFAEGAAERVFEASLEPVARPG